MVLLGGVVDIVDSVDDIDDILNRYRLVGTQYHGGIVFSGNTFTDDGSQLIVSDWSFVDVILEMFVDIDGKSLLGHGLAAAGGQ